MEDENWLARLYTEHKRLLFAVAWNLLNRRDLAEDAVHAAIVRLASLSYRPDNPRLYAIRAVRNTAIDYLKQRSRRREEPWDEDLEQLDSSSQELDACDERLQALQSALYRLDTESREVIQLHLQARLSFRELAEMLEVPISTVASRYRRGIAKVKLLVEVQYE